MKALWKSPHIFEEKNIVFCPKEVMEDQSCHHIPSNLQTIANKYLSIIKMTKFIYIVTLDLPSGEEYDRGASVVKMWTTGELYLLVGRPNHSYDKAIKCSTPSSFSMTIKVEPIPLLTVKNVL